MLSIVRSGILILVPIFNILISSLLAERSYFSFEKRVQEIFNTHKSSVVRVKATKEVSINDKNTRQIKMGSGFFVSKNGHILTTGLLSDPERIWVEHNKSFYLAEHLGSDTQCNLSLLKTLEIPKDFSFVSFDSPNNALKEGSFLVGLTCALEFETGPIFGLMQSYETTFGRSLFPTKMLRASLSLGPGEVGGPVFDLSGNFIGITYAALPDISSSFILNARACSRIRDGLMLSGKVDYGWFGITVSRKANKYNSYNIEVKSALPNSKLKSGDILIQIGDQQIFDRGDILESTFFATPGTFVDFLIKRNGEEITIPIRVARRSNSEENHNSVPSVIKLGADSNKTNNIIGSSKLINSDDPKD